MPTDCDLGLRGAAVRSDNTLLVGGIWGCRDGHNWQVEYKYDPNAPYQKGVNPSVHTIDHWHLPSLEHRYRNGQFCSMDYDGASYGYAIDQKSTEGGEEEQANSVVGVVEKNLWA